MIGVLVLVILLAAGFCLGRATAPRQADLAAAHAAWHCEWCDTELHDVPFDVCVAFIGQHMDQHRAESA